MAGGVVGVGGGCGGGGWSSQSVFRTTFSHFSTVRLAICTTLCVFLNIFFIIFLLLLF
jgi:hypothetical protein